MDPPTEEWYQKCACGKRFYQPNSYTHHIQGCTSYKKGVGSSLEGARARWAAKSARPKKGKDAISAWYGERDLDVDHDISRPNAGPSTPAIAGRPETPPPEPTGRGLRVIKPVERYGSDFEPTSTMLFHFVPEPPSSKDSDIPTAPSGSSSVEDTIPLAVQKRQSILDEGAWKSTRRNIFGLWKHYWTVEDRPHNPESHISPLDILDDGDPQGESVSEGQGNQTVKKTYHSRYHPFPNLSSYLLGQWFWSEEHKSRESLHMLVDILTSEGFKPEDLLSTNWTSISATLASSEFEDSESMWVDDGESWQTSSVTIEVPFNSTSATPGSHPFTVEGFRFRPLISVIRAKLQDTGHAEHFHFVPYDLRWQPQGTASDTRVYGDLYHSPAFLDAYREVQSLPPEPSEDHLPRYVVGLMFASDQTMLASFGDAKLWPVYMLYGNESKYRRSKVSLGLFEEVAYFRTLPDDFTDWYINRSGKKTRRLPGEESTDGVYVSSVRLNMLYRTVVVSIRSMGQLPCCKCLIPRDDIIALGQPSDRHARATRQRHDDPERQAKVNQARELIYHRKHLAVNSKQVEAILKPTSLVPTKNAFSERLLPVGFDMYSMVVVDILHEVEIGVWKSLFLHLLRILEAENPALVNILDQRYRQVPAFGKDTIRRFSTSVSLQKQLAARNYEDMLQCAIPVFEGLLPADHDLRVRNLLFSLGHWHALAKMRMHTDLSLDVLDHWTTLLGEDARIFIELTCSEFETRELKREFEARKRAQARRSKAGSTSRKGGPVTEPVGSSGVNSDGGSSSVVTAGGASMHTHPILKKAKRSKKTPAVEKEVAEDSGGLTEGDARQSRTWNINTPKFHALGDVVLCIRRFGTTDSYSTQLSERFHRVSKGRYRKTNKRNIHRQLSRLQARQARLKRLRRQIDPPAEEQVGPPDTVRQEYENRWYFIGKSQNNPVNLTHFIRTHTDDWATKGFLLKLKLHLMPRVIQELLRESKMDPEQYGQSIPTLEALSQSFKTEDVNHLHFHSDRIYRHSVFKLRFTTYDCRADHDIFNPSTSRRDFMCIRGDMDSGEGSAGDDGHYQYGRILGVFHTNVLYSGPGALDNVRRRFDFLWVRWFVSRGDSPPWLDRSLDVVSLARAGSPDACGFLNPAEVLRAAHIIPRFSAGPLFDVGDEQSKSSTPLFSRCAQDRSDWKEYLVNRFVDRDMMMRFHHGLTPGHSSVQPRPRGAPSPGSPMECEVEPAFDDATLDSDMADEVPTDSDDSEYDALPVPGRLSGEEDNSSESDDQEPLSDVPEPDSDLENTDVFA